MIRSEEDRFRPAVVSLAEPAAEDGLHAQGVERPDGELGSLNSFGRPSSVDRLAGENPNAPILSRRGLAPARRRSPAR
jgi:hypothetical protein